MKAKKWFKLSLPVVLYILVWALSVLVFWCFMSGSDAFAYTLLFHWLVLPIATVVASFAIGIVKGYGKWKWGLCIFFGIMCMLAEYSTFSVANNIANSKINTPNYGLFIIGTGISVLAMGLGQVLLCNKEAKMKEAIKG